MRISRYYLENQNGTRIDMNNPLGCLFTDAEGFGVSYSADYLKVGNIWSTNTRELNQPTPKGKMIFYTDKGYRDFLTFIEEASKLYLVYKPKNEDDEYISEVELVEMDKSNKGKSRHYEVPITFACKSLFYTREQFVPTYDREFKWDFPWRTRFNDGSAVRFAVDNNGQAESGFVLAFSGRCKNPVMKVIKDNKVINEITFNIDLMQNERIELSTIDDDLYIKVNGEIRADILDFTKNNFFKIPKGESILLFEREEGRFNNLVLEFGKYYKGV